VAEPEPSDRERTLLGLQEQLERAAREAGSLLGGIPPDAAARHASSNGSSAGDGEVPPPGGWQRPGADAAAGDEDALARLLARLGILAELAPAEVREHLAAALRELLLALRALIDWYLERSERRAQPVEVRDIPIL
jgi:hypothetical protein